MCLGPASLSLKPAFLLLAEDAAQIRVWVWDWAGEGPAYSFLLQCGWPFCLPGWACGALRWSREPGRATDVLAARGQVSLGRRGGGRIR